MATNNAWNNTISDAIVTLNGGTVNIATDAAAHTVTIGNNTGATAVNIDIGTGDFTLDSASGTLISQLDTGEMTQPLQPAFMAYLASDDTNVTGGGTTYTLGTDVALTEVFDRGGDFNTNGTFTAPVTGRYKLICNIRMFGIAAGMNGSFMQSQTSNANYTMSVVSPVASQTVNSDYTFFGGFVADMDLGDTAILVINISGATDVADIDGDAVAYTYFCGQLVA